MESNLSLIKKDTVDVVAEKVRGFQESGEIHLPANYSVENAMKSAWLLLQSLETRDKKPVLQECSRDSIANSLLDMAVQGLNPAKKQCYFIAYGKQLSCQRSYFGTMEVAKFVAGAKDVYAQVIYADDEFEYELYKGRKRILKHSQKLDNVSSDKIVAAYCTIEFEDPEKNITEIMTMEQIRASWAKSRNGGAVQKEFPEEMAKRTVVNRACKSLINSSNDSALLMDTIIRAEKDSSEVAVTAEIAENANIETIDVEVREAIPEPAPVKQEAPPANKEPEKLFDPGF